MDLPGGEVEKRPIVPTGSGARDVGVFSSHAEEHPTVESAINHGEHRGLSRVYAYGTEGFKRVVALVILSANLYRLGSIIQSRAGTTQIIY